MKGKLKAVNVNRIVSGIAFIISIGTLFTFVYQTKLIREHQYATVMPYLEIWDINNSKEYSVNIFNRGLGPAFIEKIQIEYKDSLYPMDLINFLGLQKLKGPYTFTNIREGMVIKEDSKISMVQKKLPRNDSTRREMEKIMDSVLIHIQYKSIYDEHWKTSSANLPVKMED